MTRTLSSFTPIDGLEGIYTARAGKLNCFAVRLQDGSLCLLSPISGTSANARDQLESLGNVTLLLAPNHYHNKGLKEYADVFPDASLVCSAASESSLKKITGLDFSPLSTLGCRLKEEYEFLEPDGLKTGEVWLQAKGAELAWIVTDAFSAKLNPPGGYAAAPTMLGTFPKYGVRDAEQFKKSVLHLLKQSAPTLLLSCHGSPVRGNGLKNLVSELLADTF